MRRVKRVDLYTRPPAPGTGVVCVDESPRQLIGEVRPTTPAAVDFATWLRKLELHCVPKHASWLNMVEIEIGVLARQRLARRIPDLDTLTTEVGAWTIARNDAGVAVKWMHPRTLEPRNPSTLAP